MEKKTKIVATLGPAPENPKIIENMILQGVDAFRFNLKHNSLEWHKKMIKEVKRVAKVLGKNTAVMVDLQGPEIRLETKNEEAVEAKPGEVLVMASAFVEGRKSVKIRQAKFFDRIKRGDNIYVDDGKIELRALVKRAGMIEVAVERGGLVGNNSGVNVPGRNWGLAMLTAKDKLGLKMVKRSDVDLVALSFVRRKKDIEKLRRMLDKRGSRAGIVAKIENQAALKNLDGIIEAVEAVMIARGDLGVEIPLEQLAFWQKKIIAKCRIAGKSVLVATQMLASMVDNTHPSRAEVSDVSNAIFDGTDGLMLSEETAVGKYPVRAVREMRVIAQFCETKAMCPPIDRRTKNAGQTLAEAVAGIVTDDNEFEVTAVVVFTQSGETAMMMSSYRLAVPVIAVTDDKTTVKKLQLSFGIIPHYWAKFGQDKFDIGNPIFGRLARRGYFDKGDRVVVIHGVNWLDRGSTSSISIKTI